MSHVEFYDGLAEIALGWLGWSEDQSLRSDVNAILIGRDGKIDMFCKIGYLEKVAEPERQAKAAPETALPKMNPALFRAMFGGGKKAQGLR